MVEISKKFLTPRWKIFLRFSTTRSVLLTFTVIYEYEKQEGEGERARFASSFWKGCIGQMVVLVPQTSYGKVGVAWSSPTVHRQGLNVAGVAKPKE